jgi:hypothetical protein
LIANEILQSPFDAQLKANIPHISGFRGDAIFMYVRNKLCTVASFVEHENFILSYAAANAVTPPASVGGELGMLNKDASYGISHSKTGRP